MVIDNMSHKKRTLFVLAKITIATHIELVDNTIEVTCLFDNMSFLVLLSKSNSKLVSELRL